jgi:hypothetical protein
MPEHTYRPHGFLDGLTPQAFHQQWINSQNRISWSVEPPTGARSRRAPSGSGSAIPDSPSSPPAAEVPEPSSGAVTATSAPDGNSPMVGGALAERVGARRREHRHHQHPQYLRHTEGRGNVHSAPASISLVIRWRSAAKCPRSTGREAAGTAQVDAVRRGTARVVTALPVVLMGGSVRSWWRDWWTARSGSGRGWWRRPGRGSCGIAMRRGRRVARVLLRWV